MEAKFMREIKYSDNIMVQRRNWCREYFAIIFQQPGDRSPWPVAVKRFRVPGRCNIYMFDWVRGETGVANRVRYSTETSTTLPASMKIIQEDFDNENVVEMVKKACSNMEFLRYSQLFMRQLLAVVAPRSKSFQVASKEIDKLIAERDRQYDEKKAKEKAQLAEELQKRTANMPDHRLAFTKRKLSPK
jgi:hypothetical protein